MPAGAGPFSSLISFFFSASQKRLGQAAGWTADVSSRLPGASQLLLPRLLPSNLDPGWGQPTFIKHPLYLAPKPWLPPARGSLNLLQLWAY